MTRKRNRLKGKGKSVADYSGSNGFVPANGGGAVQKNRPDRRQILFWRSPFRTLLYFVLELVHIVWDFGGSIVSSIISFHFAIFAPCLPFLFGTFLLWDYKSKFKKSTKGRAKSHNRQQHQIGGKRKYLLFCPSFVSLFGLFVLRFLLPFLLAFGSLLFLFFVPGAHSSYVRHFEKKLLWCFYWLGLGVLSSIGLGTGLHTFLLYLGPHIARVTLAAFECNSLDFPEPPYPDDVTCSTDAMGHSSLVTLWTIIAKVRLESLMWGAGTALGELPPFFMARAARLSGHEPDSEEYREFIAIVERDATNQMNLMERIKLWMERAVTRMGFPGILLFASIPNPFFDLAGITCGHFLIPFWTFFGATLIGKALVKMHMQMLFVVLTFSEHHVEHLVSLLNKIPRIGTVLQAPLKEFLQAQKISLHRRPGDPIPEQASSLLQQVMSYFVSAMILWFVYSLINSLAQQYQRRMWEKERIDKKL